jgi:hypothetical protein
MLEPPWLKVGMNVLHASSQDSPPKRAPQKKKKKKRHRWDPRHWIADNGRSQTSGGAIEAALRAPNKVDEMEEEAMGMLPRWQCDGSVRTDAVNLDGSRLKLAAFQEAA